MFALNYTNEGNNQSIPYSATIAVSENKEKLCEKLHECVIEDIDTDEDETNCNANWNIIEKYEDSAILENPHLEVYCKYFIQEVEVL